MCQKHFFFMQTFPKAAALAEDGQSNTQHSKDGHRSNRRHKSAHLQPVMQTLLKWIEPHGAGRRLRAQPACCAARSLMHKSQCEFASFTFQCKTLHRNEWGLKGGARCVKLQGNKSDPTTGLTFQCKTVMTRHLNHMRQVIFRFFFLFLISIFPFSHPLFISANWYIPYFYCLPTLHTVQMNETNEIPCMPVLHIFFLSFLFVYAPVPVLSHVIL